MKKDIPDLILDLYNEVTPEGRKLLDELIDRIVFQLDCIRIIPELDEKRKATDKQSFRKA